MIEPVAPEPKSRDRTVVAHISDLHFRSNTDIDDGPWPALLQDIRHQKVDCIAVTGDLVDGALADWFDSREIVFRKVREFLAGPLCDAAGVNPDDALVVVPGNHDVRAKGLLWSSHEGGTFRRELGTFYRPLLAPSLGVCVFVLDSNSVGSGITLATGRIDEQDLVNLAAQVDWLLKHRPTDWQRCTSVALLHHHPMPIAATEHRNTLSGDQWTLLKNAGRLMNQAVRSGIDLLLHGHQHVPAISKAVFPYEGDFHHVAVVGAGSVGSDRHCSYNLLSIESSGQITVERRDLDGASYQTGLRRSLSDYSDSRRRKYLRLTRTDSPLLHCRRYIRTNEIQESGDMDVHERWEDIFPIGPDRVAESRFTVEAPSGFFPDPEFQSLTGGCDVTFEWVGPANSGRREGLLKFQPPLTSERAVSYVSKRTIVGAVHFNQQDLRAATGRSDTRETLSIRARQCVPESYVLHVHYPLSRGPDAPMLAAYDASGSPDVAEGQYASRYLCCVPGKTTLSLALDRPLPGYRYELSWKLPKYDPVETSVSETTIIEAGDIRDFLLSLREPDQRIGRQHVETLLQGLIDRVEARYTEVSSLGLRDEIGATLWCFDPDRLGLRPVAGAGCDHLAWQWEHVIKLGTTCVGVAFQRREVATWLKHRAGSHDFWDYGGPHEAILSIPLIYPFKDGIRIAVVSIASREPGRRFSHLLVGNETAWIEIVEEAMMFLSKIRPSDSQSLSTRKV